MLQTAELSCFDTSNLSSVENRFLERVERRSRFLRQLREAGLGVYLSPNEDQREKTIESLILICARQGELPRLRPEVIQRAARIMNLHIEKMQSVLPHDVQYRNRTRQRNW